MQQIWGLTPGEVVPECEEELYNWTLETLGFNGLFCWCRSDTYEEAEDS